MKIELTFMGIFLCLFLIVAAKININQRSRIKKIQEKITWLEDWNRGKDAEQGDKQNDIL